MDYIATFFTHFAALRFARELEKRRIPHRMTPVPRSLSASCGTCVSFSFAGDALEAIALVVEDTEGMFRVDADSNYHCVFKAEEV